jgi:WD domain, G-beta repeat
LDNARRRQQIASWQAEARLLHQAEEWAAVVKIGERLHNLDPAAADPDGPGELGAGPARLALPQRAAAAQRRRVAAGGRGAGAAGPHLSGCHGSARTGTLGTPRPGSITAAPTIAPHPKAVQILRHRKAFNAVAFSPDSHRLATASDDHTARI